MTMVATTIMGATTTIVDPYCATNRSLHYRPRFALAAAFALAGAPVALAPLPREGGPLPREGDPLPIEGDLRRGGAGSSNARSLPLRILYRCASTTKSVLRSRATSVFLGLESEVSFLVVCRTM